MMLLSQHFSLHEATHSDTAARLGIDNSAPPDIIPALIATADHMEVVRGILQVPIRVSSWYRCPKLNSKLGSNPTSQHIKGEAVDFTAESFGSPLDVIRKLKSRVVDVNYDQLIFEHSWVHVSWSNLPGAVQRNQVLSLLANGHYAQGITTPTGQPII